MTNRRTQPMILGFGLLVLTACSGPATATGSPSSEAPVPLGVDLGASTRAPARVVLALAGSGGQRLARSAAVSSGDNPRLVHDGHGDAHASGVVNTVDPTQHKINLSHEPIPSIGWPAMTMDFPVAPSVDLSTVKPGSRVNFTIGKGKSGMYEVQSVQPVAKGR